MILFWYNECYHSLISNSIEKKNIYFVQKIKDEK